MNAAVGLTAGLGLDGDRCIRVIPRQYLLKEPILKYPKPDQPYVLYTDASRYAWAGVLTQAYVYEEEGREFSIHHPINYVSGLFKGPQLNWAALTKEAYVIYMVARKLDYYL